MSDIALDSGTHDLKIIDGDIQLFLTKEDAVVQKVKIRLQSSQGSWYRDINEGIPYHQEIFGKTYTKGLADNHIKVVIAETEGIASLLSYNSVLATRELRVTFAAKLVTGEVIESTQLSVEV